MFNQEKLDWLNREHLKKLDDKELVSLAQPFVSAPVEIAKILPLVRERVSNFGELRELVVAGEFNYFFQSPNYDKSLLGETIGELEKVKKLLAEVPESKFTTQNLRTVIMPYADERGRKNVLWPWRVALTGRQKSADPFTVASILGKEETIKRIDDALAK